LSLGDPEPEVEPDVEPIPTIAVLPFDVSGNEDLEYLSEGMVRLLGNKLDGLGDLASADANAVLSFVDRQDGRVDIEVGKELARHMQASGFILGSVISAGNTIRMSASLYGADGEKQATDEWTGRSDSLLIPAIDSMATKLVADRLNLEGREIASVAALTSHSFEALKHYLAGERLLRQGRDFDVQVEEFRRAVQIDSTFSLAWYGLRRASGWTSRYRALSRPASKAAIRHSTSLPAKIRVPMLALDLNSDGRWQEAERLIRPYLQLHPQDPEAWYALGEIVYHNYPRIGRSPLPSQSSFEKAYAIDPSNWEYRSHLVDLLLPQQRFGEIHARTQNGQRALELLQDSTGDRNLDRMALEQGTLDPDVAIQLVWGSIVGKRPETTRKALRSLDEARADGSNLRQYYRLASGQFEEALSEDPLPEEHIVALWVPRILPFKSFSGEELQRMRQLAVDWDTTSSPVTIRPSPLERLNSDEGRYHYRYDVLKAFAVGSLSLAMGDRPGVERAATSLWDPSASPYDSTLAKSLHNLLLAMEAFRNNDLDAALDLVNATRVRTELRFRVYPYYSESLARWIRAEILLAKGEYETARNWYRTIEFSEVGGRAWPVFLAPSIYKEAVCDEALGEYQSALENYRLFIEYWRDADEDLQPIVDEARAGIERVQAAMVREPDHR
jgi:tetratricopeptide (TPR) repeat protein